MAAASGEGEQEEARRLVALASRRGYGLEEIVGSRHVIRKVMQSNATLDLP